MLRTSPFVLGLPLVVLLPVGHPDGGVAGHDHPGHRPRRPSRRPRGSQPRLPRTRPCPRPVPAGPSLSWAYQSKVSSTSSPSRLTVSCTTRAPRSVHARSHRPVLVASVTGSAVPAGEGQHDRLVEPEGEEHVQPAQRPDSSALWLWGSPAVPVRAAAVGSLVIAVTTTRRTRIICSSGPAGRQRQVVLGLLSCRSAGCLGLRVGTSSGCRRCGVRRPGSLLRWSTRV